MATPLAIPPVAPPSSTSLTLQHFDRRQYHATVEEHYDESEDFYASSPSSEACSQSPSRDEHLETYDWGMAYIPSLDLSAKLVLAQAQSHAALARRDYADLARSVWGLVPPRNFGVVDNGLYRSSYPKPENFQFLRAAGIKTILTLVSGELPELYKRFIADSGIAHYQIHIEPNKDPKQTIGSCKMNTALGVILQRGNQPLLIHCNKGKHRTGTVVGCLRKIMGWEMDTQIIREYRHYAAQKARRLDERYIEKEYDERGLRWLARMNGYTTKSDSDEECEEIQEYDTTTVVGTVNAAATGAAVTTVDL